MTPARTQHLGEPTVPATETRGAQGARSVDIICASAISGLGLVIGVGFAGVVPAGEVAVGFLALLMMILLLSKALGDRWILHLSIADGDLGVQEP